MKRRHRCQEGGKRQRRTAGNEYRPGGGRARVRIGWEDE